MANVEEETKSEITIWIRKVEVPWTKREAVDGRGMCLGLTVASGNSIVTRPTEAKKVWIRSMNEWAKGEKLKSENMESFKWS